MGKLAKEQLRAIFEMRNGSILRGGTGSGKSRTALGYFLMRVCGAGRDVDAPLPKPKDLYIITIPKKRDDLEWDRECSEFGLSKDQSISRAGIKVVIDSWNNAHKYVGVSGAFFIFDEQRAIGYGTWAKSMIKISKSNQFVMLTATPGDTWMDYMSIFIANSMYTSKTDFVKQHVVYDPYSKFPKVRGYMNVSKLIANRDRILVNMRYAKRTKQLAIKVPVSYDAQTYDFISKKRADPDTGEPFRNASAYCHALRRLVNSDPSRCEALKKIISERKKAIVFYNFNHELEILRNLFESEHIEYSEYNSHNHEKVPTSSSWAYLVNYMSGAEGWECTTADTVVFFSLNYSYRIMDQSAGRVDRRNTPFDVLYIYRLVSDSKIDKHIESAIKHKKTFNESAFAQMNTDSR